MPFNSVHDQPGTLGFVIHSPGGENLLFLTDTCYTPYKYDNLNIIAVEANHSEAILRRNVENGSLAPELYARILKNHMSIERCIALLKKNDLSRCRQIFLLHLSAGNSNAEEFRLAVEKATGVPTTVCPERTAL